jgi:hypothetical protein
MRPRADRDIPRWFTENRRGGEFDQSARAATGPTVLGWLILCVIKPEWDTFGLFHAGPVEPLPNKIPPRQEPPAVPDKSLRPFPARVFDVGEHIELPDRGDKQTVKLATVLPVGGLAIHLYNPEGNPVKFQVRRDPVAKKWTIAADSWIVATLQHEARGDVTFAWGDNVPAVLECLRNTVLSLHAGGNEKRVALRAVQYAPPVILDLSKEVTNCALDFKLWEFDQDKLRIEVQGIDISDEPEKPKVAVEKFDPKTSGDRRGIGTHLGVQFGPTWDCAGERPVRPSKGLASPLC